MKFILVAYDCCSNDLKLNGNAVNRGRFGLLGSLAGPGLLWEPRSMGLDIFREPCGNQQIAPVGFRELNRVSESIETAATQLEHRKTKTIHRRPVEIPKKR